MIKPTAKYNGGGADGGGVGNLYFVRLNYIIHNFDLCLSACSRGQCVKCCSHLLVVRRYLFIRNVYLSVLCALVIYTQF